MLVLTRKPTEVIRLKLPDGRFIDITNVRMSTGACRIGVDAPKDVEIVRGELIASGVVIPAP